MDSGRTLQRIRDLGLIAVVRGTTAEDAIEVSDSLIEGGILCVEIAFTTPRAQEVMAKLGRDHGEKILLGAGTITDKEQAKLAARAGAQFLVSPGLDPELVPHMRETGLTVLPGVLTPSEVMLASRLSFQCLKLFPGSLGGSSYLKTLRGPFPELSFVPTGGVSPENASEWFEAGAIAVGSGSVLAPPSLKDLDRATVVGYARRFVEAVRKAQDEARTTDVITTEDRRRQR